MKYKDVKEEELKNKVASDYFWLYDCTRIIGNVDFCVSIHQSQKELFEQESLLWAEAKKGSADIYKSIVQLILTIGKARTFDKYLPPAFLGAFDAEKIAFIPYNDIHEIFYMNDFNWNVTPSNHDTKEFKLIHEKVRSVVDSKALLFNFTTDDRELKKFIKKNFVVGKFGITKIQIDKNNFMIIYNKWLQTVKPTIAVKWENAKKIGLIDGDFYLADLLSYDNISLKEKLYILLKKDHYEMDRGFDEMGLQTIISVYFSDNQVAHTQFWNKYQRPPKEEYWDYIVERRDLLVPQDIRERKGSFFTPQMWVELSQKYLTDVFGQDWQDEYFVWDCAAGTGNLLAGLTNKYNIYASTLDKQDVEVMHDRISNGANLLHDHVFQFDFLNDDFVPISQGGKLPDSLYKIITDDKQRKKLIIYINPPYAEATTARTITGTGENKAKTATENKTYLKYRNKISKASNELFAQFLIRIYEELNNCKIANFSTLKILQSTNFREYRNVFLARLEKLFVMPANTFDNVKGKFPIGFFIWDTAKKERFKQIQADVYNHKAEYIGKKGFYGNLPESLNKWLSQFEDEDGKEIGLIVSCPPDFQHNNQLALLSKQQERYCKKITQQNLIQTCIYFAVRHCIEATWLNDRDQFLYPNNTWQNDEEFKSDCLIFTLFHGQNRITSKHGTNHWIPFTEIEVNARDKFESNFMSKFITGKIKPDKNSLNFMNLLFEPEVEYKKPLKFSSEAKALFDTGRELWKYYHKQPSCNVNASLYDIKEHFQGRNPKGKMNNKSTDETYNNLIAELREKLKILAQKIEPKVYEHGFLKP